MRKGGRENEKEGEIGRENETEGEREEGRMKKKEIGRNKRMVKRERAVWKHRDRERKRE